AHLGRGSDVPHPQGLGHLKTPIVLVVGHLLTEAVVESVELDAGLVELTADIVKLRERDAQPPLAQLVEVFRLGLNVSLPKLALPQTDFLIALDRLRQRSITERVALCPDLDSAEHRINPIGAPQRRTRRRQPCHTCHQPLACIPSRHQCHQLSLQPESFVASIRGAGEHCNHADSTADHLLIRVICGRSSWPIWYARLRPCNDNSKHSHSKPSTSQSSAAAFRERPQRARPRY